MKKIEELLQTEVIIFDLDGLLIDSEPLWGEAMINVFGKYGVSLTKEYCQSFQGIRIEEVCPIVLKEKNIKDLDNQSLSDEIITEMILLLENVRIMPGAIETIDFYYSRQKPVAIASSSNLSYIKKAVEIMGIADKIDLINSAEFEPAGKPEPFVFQTVASKMKVQPQKCLVFEDSKYGVLAAKRANMNVVAVPLHPNQNNKDFEIADFIIGSLIEWLEIVEKHENFSKKLL